MLFPLRSKLIFTKNIQIEGLTQYEVYEVYIVNDTFQKVKVHIDYQFVKIIKVTTN